VKPARGPQHRRSALRRLAVALTLLCCSGLAQAADPVTPEQRADHIAGQIRAAQSMHERALRWEALRVAAREARAAAQPLPRDSLLWRRLVSDQLFALSLAGDHAEAVAVYDELRAAGHPLRSYLVAAAADSLFETGRAAEGEQLLLDSARENPGDVRPIIRLAELLSDHGRTGAARQRLQDWLAQAPPPADAARLEASLLLARLERWSEDFDASDRRLRALAAEFPQAAAIGVERAALERQRGHPRAALALLAGRDDADARATQAEAWLDLGRSDRAAALAAPEVARRLEHERGSRGLLSAGYAHAKSTAAGSPNGNEEVMASARVDSRRLAERWRLGAHAAMHRADFQGQQPEVQQLGARLTRHDSGGESTLEVGRTVDDFLERSYGVLEGGYWLQDAWRLGARLALEDPAGPLQARASGIGIDSLQLTGSYRPDPNWRADLGIGASRFDDGNRRRYVALGGERRLRVSGSAITTGILGLYAARNTRDAAPYFNPRSSSSAELGLVHRYAGFLHSEQQLRLSIAAVAQHDYDTAAVPALGYGLRLPLGPGWVGWDFAAARPVYDGQRETRLSATMSYGWGSP